MDEKLEILRKIALNEFRNEIEFFAERVSAHIGHVMECHQNMDPKKVPLYLSEETYGPVNVAVAKALLRRVEEPMTDPEFLKELAEIVNAVPGYRDLLPAGLSYTQGKLFVLKEIFKVTGDEVLSDYADFFAAVELQDIIEP